MELSTHEKQSKGERSETQHLIGTTPVVDPLKLKFSLIQHNCKDYKELSHKQDVMLIKINRELGS